MYHYGHFDYCTHYVNSHKKLVCDVSNSQLKERINVPSGTFNFLDQEQIFKP